MKLKNTITSGDNVIASKSTFETIEGTNTTSSLQLSAQNVNYIPQSFTQNINENQVVS